MCTVHCCSGPDWLSAGGKSGGFYSVIHVYIYFTLPYLTLPYILTLAGCLP